MANNTIDKPIMEYNQIYKQAIKSNAEKYFEDLVKKSKLNVEENHKLVKEYNTLNDDYISKRKKSNNTKTLFIFLVVVSIISFIVGCIFLYVYIKNRKTWMVITSIALIVVGIGLFIYDLAVVKKKKSARENSANIAEEKAKKKLSECYEQMKCLNSLYDYNMPDDIFMKTVPSIVVDDQFKMERYSYMVQKFGLPLNNDKNTHSSILGCKSGHIQGNPFLVLRTLNQYMYDETYIGSATHVYTTVVRDSQGHSRTVTHTETVTATVVKPASGYYENEQLLYANPAAPDLTFSREPTISNNMKEKQMQKFIKKQTKANIKKEEKDLMDNDANTNYTKMSNDEFEALFNATNRNNETQFRLMFTPLAQQNIVSLIKESIFGDDFSFSKEYKINRIYSKHAQNFPIISYPSRYVSHDVDESREKFVSYMIEYFNNLYFELAPILSVPLYQQTKPFEFIYHKDYNYNLNPYEHEKISNLLNQKSLMDSSADTLGINKIKYVESIGNIDIVDVTNSAFHKTPQVTIVPTRCSNGDVIDVPVNWFRYDPVEKITTCAFINDEGKTSKEVCNDIQSEFNSSNISFANKKSMVYNTSVAGFAFDRLLDKIEEYPQVRTMLDEFKTRYLNRQNSNASVNKNK